MTEKVKLSKEVADALEAVQRQRNNETIIKLHASGPDGWWEKVRHLNGMSLDTLCRALYVGYEVEKTPEEQIREYYERCQESYGYFESCGIKNTLDILEIKIEGVND